MQNVKTIAVIGADERNFAVVNWLLATNFYYWSTKSSFQRSIKHWWSQNRYITRKNAEMPCAINASWKLMLFLSGHCKSSSSKIKNVCKLLSILWRMMMSLLESINIKLVSILFSHIQNVSGKSCNIWWIIWQRVFTRRTQEALPEYSFIILKELDFVTYVSQIKKLWNKDPTLYSPFIYKNMNNRMAMALTESVRKTIENCCNRTGCYYTDRRLDSVSRRDCGW
jgi:hypothetical protein